VVSLTHAASGSVVGPRAQLTLVTSTKDDLAIASVEVHLHTTGSSEPLSVVSLWNGPASVEASSIEPLGPSDERRLTGTLDLQRLDLQPGQSIEIVAIARDYKPQEGRSAPQQLRIVDESELEDRLLQLQSRLIAIVNDALRQQRETRGQTQSLELQFEESNELQSRDSDRLKGIDLHQRQIGQMLIAAPESALAQAQGIINEIQLNQLPLEIVQQQLQVVINTLGQWQTTDIPNVERAILAATKQLSSNLEASQGATDTLRSSIQKAANEQDQFLRKLEELAAQLSEWEGFRRFAGEVRQLERDQRQLLDDATALQAETLGRDLSQLSAEQRTRLRRASQQQMDLVRRFDDLARRMSAAQVDASDDPAAAAALRTALEVIEQRSIAVQMRESAEHAERNKLSEATSRQRDVLAGLAELLDALTGRQSSDTGPQASALRSAAEQLSQLQQAQQDLDRQRAALAAAGSSADERQRQELANQQRQLADRARAMADQLQRSSPQAAEAMRQAAEAMESAATNTEDDDLAQADAAANEANAALEQAATALQQSMSTQQQSDASQLKAELLERLTGFQRAQIDIHTRTQAIDDNRDLQGELDDEDQKLARSLGGEQQVLAVKIQQLAERASDWTVFAHLLGQTSSDMQDASARLLQADTSLATQEMQLSALDRIAEMLEALQRQSTQENDPAEPPTVQQEPTQPPQSPEDAPRVSVEELELLQIMQAALAERTAKLQQREVETGSSEQLHAQKRALAKEQARLSELLIKIFSQ